MNTIKDFNTAIKLLDNARIAYENYMELKEKALEFIESKCDEPLQRCITTYHSLVVGAVSSNLSIELNNYIKGDDYALAHSTELKYALKDAMNVKDYT